MERKIKIISYTTIMFTIAILCSAASLAAVTWPALAGEALTAERINYLHAWDVVGGNINSSSNIGIGTNDSTEGGQVSSRFTIRQSEGSTALAVFNSTAGKVFALNPLAGGGFLIYDGSGNVWNQGIAQKGGNVGIGTADPTSKLAVNGRIEDKTGFVSPPGAIIMYAGITAPKGWLLCDGSTISRTTYADLYNAIGTNYGAGDGSTTFTLPDFRGIFPKGAGTQGTASWTDGNYAGTLGNYNQDKFQGHYHTLSGLTGLIMNVQTGTSIMRPLLTATGAAQTLNPLTGTQGTVRTGFTTEPASLGVNFIIKY